MARPAKGKNKANTLPRDCSVNIRCSHALLKTLDLMVKGDFAKSKADIIHEAVQLLAMRKNLPPEIIHWVNKIV